MIVQSPKKLFGKKFRMPKEVIRTFGKSEKEFILIKHFMFFEQKIIRIR